jgi:hypothetical protein
LGVAWFVLRRDFKAQKSSNPSIISAWSLSLTALFLTFFLFLNCHCLNSSLNKSVQ